MNYNNRGGMKSIPPRLFCACMVRELGKAGVSKGAECGGAGGQGAGGMWGVAAEGLREGWPEALARVRVFNLNLDNAVSMQNSKVFIVYQEDTR